MKEIKEPNRKIRIRFEGNREIADEIISDKSKVDSIFIREEEQRNKINQLNTTMRRLNDKLRDRIRYGTVSVGKCDVCGNERGDDGVICRGFHHVLDASVDPTDVQWLCTKHYWMAVERRNNQRNLDLLTGLLPPEKIEALRLTDEFLINKYNNKKPPRRKRKTTANTLSQEEIVLKRRKQDRSRPPDPNKAEYNKRYRAMNKDKLTELNREWRLKNPEKVKAQSERDYKNFKLKMTTNPEFNKHVTERNHVNGAKYREVNKDVIKIRQHAYNNSEHGKAVHQAWYKDNKDKIAKQSKLYQEQRRLDPEKVEMDRKSRERHYATDKYIEENRRRKLLERMMYHNKSLFDRVYNNPELYDEVVRRKDADIEAYHSEKNVAQRTKARNMAVSARRSKSHPLTRQPCEVCGRTIGSDGRGIHGHHEDYSKPLDLVWLCHDHHVIANSRMSNNANIKLIRDLITDEEADDLIMSDAELLDSHIRLNKDRKIVQRMKRVEDVMSQNKE